MAVITCEPTSFPIPHHCFVCGEQVDFPYIFWQGAGEQGIALHTHCAEYLGLNILNDYLESQKHPTARRKSHVK